MMENLRNKAVTGVMWTSIQRFMTIFIQFVSGIILARLLTPDDYGCIGMLSIFMLIAASFIDGGFGSALIQKKQPTQEDYSTIFYWNVGISTVIYLLLFFAAPWIANFYHIELLCSVLRVQGLVLIINALQVVQTSQLNKQFKFKKLSIVTLCSTVVSLVVTIILAYKGFGVWALVTQNLLMAIIPTTVYWLTNGWLPSWTFSVSSFKELFSFGFYIFLTSLLSAFVNNIQGLLIGRIYNSATMGYYSKAHSTEKLSSTSISQVVGQVSYPLYAELQDNKERLADTIKKLTQSLTYITFPLMLLLCLVAEPLFCILYGDKWLPAVPYFQLLCIAGLAICLQAVNSQAIAAIGKSKEMFIWALIKQSAGLALMLSGMYFGGIWGLLVGMVLKSWIIYIIHAGLVSHYIGYKMKKQAYDILPILLVVLFSFAVSYCSSSFFKDNMYIAGCVRGVVFVGIYVSLSLLFKLDAFKISWDLLSPYLHKLKRR